MLGYKSRMVRKMITTRRPTKKSIAGNDTQNASFLRHSARSKRYAYIFSTQLYTFFKQTTFVRLQKFEFIHDRKLLGMHFAAVGTRLSNCCQIF